MEYEDFMMALTHSDFCGIDYSCMIAQYLISKGKAYTWKLCV
jgi:hypothetical protein